MAINLVSVDAMRIPGLRRLLAALLLCASLGAPLAVRADDANAGAKAKEHYLKGQTHYALGEFNEAITEFREAFRLRDEPAILFNIAQAMRQLNNYKQAYFYYSQYLSKRPNASNRAEVEGFMESMHKKMEADEEADKARANAEAARPPSPKHPDDHLAEAEGQKSGATPAAAPVKAAEKGAPKPDGKKVAAAAPAKPAAAPPATAPHATTIAAVPAAPLPEPAAQRPLPAPSEATTAAPPSTDKPGWATGPHVAGAAALGVGAVAGVLSFVFHGSAQAAADTLDQHYASHAVMPGDTQLKDTVKSKGQLATVAAIGCAALAVSGAVLTFVF
jgi:hypothetical protein